MFTAKPVPAAPPAHRYPPRGYPARAYQPEHPPAIHSAAPEQIESITWYNINNP